MMKFHVILESPRHGTSCTRMMSFCDGNQQPAPPAATMTPAALLPSPSRHSRNSGVMDRRGRSTSLNLPLPETSKERSLGRMTVASPTRLSSCSNGGRTSLVLPIALDFAALLAPSPITSDTKVGRPSTGRPSGNGGSSLCPQGSTSNVLATHCQEKELDQQQQQLQPEFPPSFKEEMEALVQAEANARQHCEAHLQIEYWKLGFAASYRRSTSSALDIWTPNSNHFLMETDKNPTSCVASTTATTAPSATTRLGDDDEPASSTLDVTSSFFGQEEGQRGGGHEEEDREEEDEDDWQDEDEEGEHRFRHLSSVGRYDSPLPIRASGNGGWSPDPAEPGYEIVAAHDEEEPFAPDVAASHGSQLSNISQSPSPQRPPAQTVTSVVCSLSDLSTFRHDAATPPLPKFIIGGAVVPPTQRRPHEVVVAPARLFPHPSLVPPFRREGLRITRVHSTTPEEYQGDYYLDNDDDDDDDDDGDGQDNTSSNFSPIWHSSVVLPVEVTPFRRAVVCSLCDLSTFRRDAAPALSVPGVHASTPRRRSGGGSPRHSVPFHPQLVGDSNNPSRTSQQVSLTPRIDETVHITTTVADSSLPQASVAHTALITTAEPSAMLPNYQRFGPTPKLGSGPSTIQDHHDVANAAPTSPSTSVLSYPYSSSEDDEASLLEEDVDDEQQHQRRETNATLLLQRATRKFIAKQRLRQHAANTRSSTSSSSLSRSDEDDHTTSSGGGAGEDLVNDVLPPMVRQRAVDSQQQQQQQQAQFPSQATTSLVADPDVSSVSRRHPTATPWSAAGQVCATVARAVKGWWGARSVVTTLFVVLSLMASGCWCLVNQHDLPAFQTVLSTTVFAWWAISPCRKAFTLFAEPRPEAQQHRNQTLCVLSLISTGVQMFVALGLYLQVIEHLKVAVGNNLWYVGLAVVYALPLLAGAFLCRPWRGTANFYSLGTLTPARDALKACRHALKDQHWIVRGAISFLTFATIVLWSLFAMDSTRNVLYSSSLVTADMYQHAQGSDLYKDPRIKSRRLRPLHAFAPPTVDMPKVVLRGTQMTAFEGLPNLFCSFDWMPMCAKQSHEDSYHWWNRVLAMGHLGWGTTGSGSEKEKMIAWGQTVVSYLFTATDNAAIHVHFAKERSPLQDALWIEQAIVNLSTSISFSTSAEGSSGLFAYHYASSQSPESPAAGLVDSTPTLGQKMDRFVIPTWLSDLCYPWVGKERDWSDLLPWTWSFPSATAPSATAAVTSTVPPAITGPTTSTATPTTATAASTTAAAPSNTAPAVTAKFAQYSDGVYC